jgi:hypothetical protein
MRLSHLMCCSRRPSPTWCPIRSVQPVAEGFFSSTGANIFRATQEKTAYAAAGTDVTARGTRDGTDIAHLDSLQVGFAGRLVDAP